MARVTLPQTEAEGSPLVERLHALIAASEAPGGLRTRFWSLAHALHVEEHQVRRAARWLADNGYLTLSPAGREGSSFVLRHRRRPQLALSGRFCPWCGRPVAADWRYCMACGGSQEGRGGPQIALTVRGGTRRPGLRRRTAQRGA